MEQCRRHRHVVHAVLGAGGSHGQGMDDVGLVALPAALQAMHLARNDEGTADEVKIRGWVSLGDAAQNGIELPAWPPASSSTPVWSSSSMLRPARHRCIAAGILDDTPCSPEGRGEGQREEKEETLSPLPTVLLSPSPRVRGGGQAAAAAAGVGAGLTRCWLKPPNPGCARRRGDPIIRGGEVGPNAVSSTALVLVAVLRAGVTPQSVNAWRRNGSSEKPRSSARRGGPTPPSRRRTPAARPHAWSPAANSTRRGGRTRARSFRFPAPLEPLVPEVALDLLRCQVDTSSQAGCAITCATSPRCRHGTARAAQSPASRGS